MKTVLLMLFVVLGDPSTTLLTAVPFESREVCEIEEGRLNKPVTMGLRPDDYEPVILDYNGIEIMFVKAKCEAFGESI